MARPNNVASNLLTAKASKPYSIQLYNERHHQRYPVPRSLDVLAIGKALTNKEWEKFTTKHLTPKLLANCERKHDGTMHFIGEDGIEAAHLLQQKFAGRFNFNMVCNTKETASVGLYLAQKAGLDILELHYKNGRNNQINVNDKASMAELTSFAPAILYQETIVMN